MVVNCEECKHYDKSSHCKYRIKKPRFIKPDMLRPCKPWGYRVKCGFYQCVDTKR